MHRVALLTFVLSNRFGDGNQICSLMNPGVVGVILMCFRRLETEGGTETDIDERRHHPESHCHAF